VSIKPKAMKLDSRLSCPITSAMRDRLDQVARQLDQPKAEIVRTALRDYLDGQVDLIGSRKHFTKAFQSRIDYLDWLHIVTLKLLLRTFSILLSTTLESVFDEDDLLEDVLGSISDKGEVLHEQLWRALRGTSKNDEPPA